MTEPTDRRSQPRGLSSTRILWSVVGRHDLQIDRLRDVSISGALVSTEAVAKVGEEIRFDLLDERGVLVRDAAAGRSTAYSLVRIPPFDSSS